MHKILVIRLYYPLDAQHVSDYISPSSGATFISCTSHLVYAGICRYVSKPVLTGRESFAQSGVRISDRPARSGSLYRLRHPRSMVTWCDSLCKRTELPYVYRAVNVSKNKGQVFKSNMLATKTYTWNPCKNLKNYNLHILWTKFPTTTMEFCNTCWRFVHKF